MEARLITNLDNNPPSEVELLQIRMSNDHEKSLSHAQALIEAADRLPTEVSDDETADKLADYIKKVGARRKDVESIRVAEKEPFLNLGRMVDGFFKNVTDRLDGAKMKAQRPLDVYMKQKAAAEQRRRDEEAKALREKAEAEAAAAASLAAANKPHEAYGMMDQALTTEKTAAKMEVAAEARPADMARTRSASGSVATLRTRWVGKVIDRSQIDYATLAPFFTDEAVQKALNAFVAAGRRELRGAVIEEESTTVVR